MIYMKGGNKMAEEQGVVVPLIDLYNSQNALGASLQEVKVQLGRIEQKLATTSDADERSREAIEIAKEAKNQSAEALDLVKKNEEDRRKFHQTLWASTISQLLPYLLIGAGYLVYLFHTKN